MTRDLHQRTAKGSVVRRKLLPAQDDDELQAQKHGVQGRRKCCKVHSALNTAMSEIRALEFT